MGVRLTNCFEDLCQNPTGFTGFALIRLVNQAEGMLVDTSVDPCRYIPCDLVYRADVDPQTGCWTSCELPCNDDLTPAGSYYEIQEFVNGKCCGSHLVQLDCASNVYPDPTPICDVSITNPGPPPSPLLCPVVKSCETPFIGVNGPGVVITAGDNPAGNPGNGHQPTFGVLLSTDAGNDLSFGTDGGLFIDVPSAFACAALNLCSIDALSDVDTTTVAPALADVLTWSGTNWVPAPIPAPVPTGLQVLDTTCLDLTVTGTGGLGDPYIISGAPIVSGAAGNALSCTPGGLFVDLNVLQVIDTPEINLGLSGAGTTASPWSLQANIVIDPTSDAPVSITPLGLKVDCCPIAAEYDFGSPAPVHGASVPGLGTPSSPLQFPVPALQVADSDCIDLVLSGTGVQSDPWIVSADVILSPALDNILVCDGNGLYVPAPLAIDHPDVALTVNLSVAGVTLSGPDNHVIDITTLSGDPGNLLSTGSDGGLFIDCADVTACVPPVGVIAGDSDCIDFTVTGTGAPGDPYVVSAEPNIDPDPDNIIACNPGGLFVPAPDGSETIITAGANITIVGNGTAGTPYVISALDGNGLVVVGSDCLDLSLSGSGSDADPWVVSGDLTIDPALNNALVCGPTGLFVPEFECSFLNACSIDELVDVVAPSGANVLGNIFVWNGTDWVPGDITVVDTSCIDLTLSGTGQVADPFVLSADPIISPDAGNGLECRANGLFVGASSTTVVGADTSCIDVTVVEAPVGTFTVSAAPVIDPSPQNILTCGAGGLLADETTTSITDNGDGTFTFVDEDGAPTTLDVCQLLTDAVAVGCAVFPGRDSAIDSDSYDVGVATVLGTHPVVPLSLGAGTLVGAWVTVDAATTTAPFTVNIVMNGVTVATVSVPAGTTTATPLPIVIGTPMPAASTGTFTLVGNGTLGEVVDDVTVTFDWIS